MALALALAAMALALASALAAASAKCLSFTFKFFYVMGKALSGELSYAWTGLVTFLVYFFDASSQLEHEFLLNFPSAKNREKFAAPRRLFLPRLPLA